MKPRNNGQFVADPNGLPQKLLKLVEAGETSREVMAQQTGATMLQVRRGLSNLAARGLIEPCGTIPSGGKPRPFNVYQIKGKSAPFVFRSGRVNSVFALGVMA